MTKTPTDPIMAELRAVRDAHAARFNYDVEAIVRDIRDMQATSGRKYIRLPARRIAVPEGSAVGKVKKRGTASGQASKKVSAAVRTKKPRR